jgi:NADH-quinone oxidoreductase subunit M
MLGWTIYISFLGAIASLCCQRAVAARLVALLTSLLCLAAAVAGLMLQPAGEIVTITRAAWIPFLGVEYHLAADGISAVLVLLAALASLAGVLFSWNVEHRPGEFFALYLTLIGGVCGVFLSFNLFPLFVFYEIAIIPKYFLISVWGSTRREYAAMKLALYSFAGSALVLAGILVVYVMAGPEGLTLGHSASPAVPRPTQLWLFPMVFAGFAVLAGLWPFHTWAPTGHVAAPTAASMLLAGVVMKLGAYGCLRVAMPMFPDGMSAWAEPVLGMRSWLDVFAVMAAVGIVYGAGASLVQTDLKFVVGYSSVSHMGFVLLGMVTLHKTGLAGSVLQMFSHGVIAGLLFAVVGRMVYDRAHTRDLRELEGMALMRSIPFAGVVFVLAAVAGMGLPGFSGFVAELQVLLGSWRAFPTLTVVAGIGILIGVAYSLRAIQKGFLGEESVPPRGTATDPITLPEKLGAILLISASVAIGLYPNLLLRWIVPAVNGPFFQNMLKGGVQ